jgi:hypothetical protein
VDGSGKMYQIYDPAAQTFANGIYSRNPFPNNQIPRTRIDPVAKAVIGFVQPLLKPNVPGLTPGTSGYTPTTTLRPAAPYRRTTNSAPKAIRY